MEIKVLFNLFFTIFIYFQNYLLIIVNPLILVKILNALFINLIFLKI
jgi:hypothetical protein